MKRAQLTVKVCGHGGKPESKEVKGYDPEVPGLGIHYSNVEQAWHIDHLESGLAVAKGFKTRDNARLAAYAIANLVDWTREAKYLKRLKTLSASVRSRISQAQ